MSNNIDIAKKIEQDRALSDLQSNDYFGLIKYTIRSGKSLIGVRALDEISKLPDDQGLPFLWVTADEKLRDFDIPNEFRKHGYDYLLDRLETVCYQSLDKVTGRYAAIILDEYQHITVKNSSTLIARSLVSDHLMGLTATHPKHFIKNYILGKLRLKEISSLTVDEAVEKKIISDYQVKIITFDLDNEETTEDRFGNKFTEYQKYNSLSGTIEFKKACAEDISFQVMARRNLLYNSLSRRKVIDFISELAAKNNQRGINFVPFKKIAKALGPHYFSGSSDKHYQKFVNEEINQISLVKMGAVGHTYKNVDYVLIGQVTKDYAGFTTQSWGRGLLYREDAVVTIYMLCANGTVEEEWVKNAVSALDPDKIEQISFNDLVKLQRA